MKKRTSLKDIAEALGVSVTLVSYVMNNKTKEGRVAPETAQKIRQTAKELNYQPNQLARSLKSKRSQTIGLIVADISNPFFANLARTIEDEAHSLNYTVIFGSSDENHIKLKKVLDFLTTRQVDGFIIAPTDECKETLIELKKSQIPFVLIDRYFEDLPTNYVIIDNFQASLDATNHLLKKGHEKIGIIHYKSELIHFKQRVNGYLKALEMSGISPDPKYMQEVTYANFEADIKAALRNLIYEEEVEAIFFCTNTLALEGLKQMFDWGIKAPGQMDVVAFDQNVVYDFFNYFIPHIKQPIKEMGQEAVRILIGQINEKVPKINTVCLRTTLETQTIDQLKLKT
ncbi:MAG: LacI family transcriptional regulator [Saprospiraceae bacterium]|nr:MAG: LacI family transcriptional regulator [Saprospiraceae bacterium]